MAYIVMAQGYISAESLHELFGDAVTSDEINSMMQETALKSAVLRACEALSCHMALPHGTQTCHWLICCWVPTVSLNTGRKQSPTFDCAVCYAHALLG